LDLIARQVVEGFITGMHRSPFHGFSVEFAEHRHYNPGESTRFIDWKLYGRTEKLFNKRFEEETNLKAHLIIDTSSSMFFPYRQGSIQNKLFFSVYAAAALIRLLRKQRDAAGLTLFSDEIHLSTPARLNSLHQQLLYNNLTRLLEDAKDHKNKNPLNRVTHAAESLHQMAEFFPRRSLVILFSDLFDQGDPGELFSALEHFRFNRHELVIFHIKDHRLEEEFDLPARPHRFIDMETGQVERLNPEEIRIAYRKKIADYFSEIRLRCGQYQIDLNEVDVKDDFREVLLPFLIKRQRMF